VRVVSQTNGPSASSIVSNSSDGQAPSTQQLRAILAAAGAREGVSRELKGSPHGPQQSTEAKNVCDSETEKRRERGSDDACVEAVSLAIHNQPRE